MDKHTPGPWHVGGEWPQLVAVYDASSVYIAHATTGVGADWIDRNPIGNERAKANARLIAAAPDLFYALKSCIQRIERPNLSPGADVVLEQAYSAIAKAVGNADASATQQPHKTTEMPIK